MRIAVIGLSTPLCYDYKNPIKNPSGDIYDTPNPILESPFGLLLLYDEVWFLNRNLCPQNMWNLPYVKFMDEEGTLPSLEGIQSKWVIDSDKMDPQLYAQYKKFEEVKWDIWRQAIAGLNIDWEAATDNHSRPMPIEGIGTSASAAQMCTLLFDLELIKRLNRNDAELVVNSVSQKSLACAADSILRAKLTELLIIDNIPNYLSPAGPYHPCIEEARDNNYLKDFRKWVTSQPLRSEEKELLDMKKEVEEAIRKYQDELFMKELNRMTHFKSMGKTLVNTALDIAADAVPGAGTVKAVVEGSIELGFSGKNLLEGERRRWQGFIVSTRNLKVTG